MSGVFFAADAFKETTFPNKSIQTENEKSLEKENVDREEEKEREIRPKGSGGISISI